MRGEILERLLADRRAKKPVALLTNLKSGEQALVYRDGLEDDAGVPGELVEAARRAIEADQSITLETAAGRVFVQVHNPPPRLIIVGAVHIAQPLARVAALADYQVVVVDPRRAFATEARFPEVALSTEWPDEALARLAPDHRTAVVTLTHDPKLDDPALAAALRSEAFYIGALGSKKSHAQRLKRLGEMGFGEAELARLHAPVGLAIGARSPAEIALSILAEVTQTRRQGARP